MAESQFSKHEISFACPGCGHVMKEQIGRLETSPTVTCPNCKEPIDITASGFAANLQRAIDDIQKTIKKLR